MSIYQRLFEYAGVFPPADLPLATAMAEYRRLRRGDNAELVGPMLVRAGQLEPGMEVGEWGVIADTALPAGRYAQVERRCTPEEVPESVEYLTSFGDVIYLESAGGDPSGLIDVIARLRRPGREVRAKLRTGGLSPAAFPGPDIVAEFVHRCVQAGVPFKATAGLHHPFPTPSAVGAATEHGFVNLLAAVRLAASGNIDRMTDCLVDADPASFDLASATWRHLGGHLPATTVREWLTGIGSCSIDEPAEHLRRLGVIEVSAG